MCLEVHIFPTPSGLIFVTLHGAWNLSITKKLTTQFWTRPKEHQPIVLSLAVLARSLCLLARSPQIASKSSPEESLPSLQLLACSLKPLACKWPRRDARSENNFIKNEILHVSKTQPGAPKRRAKQRQELSGRLQEWSKSPQAVCKTAMRVLETAPRAPKTTPRWVQDVPRSLQDGSKSA